MTIEGIARDPSWLLHGVDPVRRQLQFRRTTAVALRDAAFIDGRADIWAESPVEFPFDAAAQVPIGATQAARTIFHMSFCGSTLLARLLDCPGKVLALKEPNCLIDLANWKTAVLQPSSAETDFDGMLRFATAMLGRRWAVGEEIVVKPPGWANNLIGDLLAPGHMRAVFVTIGRDRFLEAVMRGGTPRIGFAARLAAHLSPFVEGGPERLQAAVDSTGDPLGKAARIALAAHDFQLRLFERAIGGGRLAAAEVVDFATIEQQPAEAAASAAAALQLGLDDADIGSNVDRWAQANAKADASFSAEQRASENAQVRAAYGPVIADGLSWAEDALGPASLQRP